MKKRKLDMVEVDESREKRRGVIEMKDSLKRQESSVYDETDKVLGMKLIKDLFLKKMQLGREGTGENEDELKAIEKKMQDLLSKIASK